MDQPVGSLLLKYDLSGFNADLHTAKSPHNASRGRFYYSANNSSDPDPGSAIVNTPPIASDFAGTSECHLASPGSLSYSCEYIQSVTLTADYSITQKIELSYADNTINKTARAGSRAFRFHSPFPSLPALRSSEPVY